MKKILSIFILLHLAVFASAQLKPRPDAFPSVPENLDSKAVTMATTIDEMASWDRYPT